MPRGGRSRGRSFSPVRRSAPAPPPIQRAPVAAQRAPVAAQRAPVPAQQPQTAVRSPGSPGLLGQMAATAGGVAIGSTMGHMIGRAMDGTDSSEQRPADVTYQEQQQPMQQQQQQQQQGGACRFELQQFLNCAENQHDLVLCDGFNMALKECKQSYGMQ